MAVIHVIEAFFDSYESAMENSSLAATHEISARFSEFADGPITFHDLDVVEDEHLGSGTSSEASM